MLKPRTTRKIKRKCTPKETIRIPKSLKRDVSFREDVSLGDTLIQLFFLCKEAEENEEKRKRSNEIFKSVRGRDRI